MCDDDATAERKMHLLLSMMKAERDAMKPINILRERLKELGELQTKTKRARKTSLPRAEWMILRADILKATDRALNCEWWDHSVAASDAKLRKIEITACLNLYHELRGSEYRHAGEGYWYEKAMTALRAELEKKA